MSVKRIHPIFGKCCRIVVTYYLCIYKSMIHLFISLLYSGYIHCEIVAHWRWCGSWDLWEFKTQYQLHMPPFPSSLPPHSDNMCGLEFSLLICHRTQHFGAPHPQHYRGILPLPGQCGLYVATGEDHRVQRIPRVKFWPWCAWAAACLILVIPDQINTCIPDCCFYYTSLPA